MCAAAESLAERRGTTGVEDELGVAREFEASLVRCSELRVTRVGDLEVEEEEEEVAGC